MTIHRAGVARVRPLTASMTRITLYGDSLAGFRGTGVGDEYVRIFLPHGPDRADLSLPRTTERGGWETPEGRPAAPMRTYTVRAVRPEAGEVDIDFVLHDGGVASGWAAGARPGDVVGLNDPTGLYSPPADLSWQVLVADQTGLPAAARLLENTPDHVRTHVPSARRPLRFGAVFGKAGLATRGVPLRSMSRSVGSTGHSGAACRWGSGGRVGREGVVSFGESIEGRTGRVASDRVKVALPKSLEDSVTNPFEDEDGTYLVLVNGEGQHSLWPAFAEVPAGWTVAHSEDTRRACLDYVERNWTDLRPKSLIESMAADPG